jgi:quinol monooxygenase YgiN
MFIAEFNERCATMTMPESFLTRRNFCAAGAGLAAMGFTRLANAADVDTSKAITQLAKFKLNMDKQDEAVQALKELCAAVEQNEPGVLAYVCSRSSKNPDELIFFEVYKDDEAMQAHGKTPHLAKLRANFATLFKPPLEITRLDRVGGFMRYGR